MKNIANIRWVNWQAGDRPSTDIAGLVLGRGDHRAVTYVDKGSKSRDNRRAGEMSP